MKLNYPRKRDGMYIISREQMDDIAEMVLREYAPHVLDVPQPVNVDLIAEEDFNLNIINMYITRNDTIIGLTAFADVCIRVKGDDLQPCDIDIPEGTIIINSSLCEESKEPRRRFTMAHELSHWILHRSYHSPTNQVYSFRSSGFIACKSASIEKWRGKPGLDWEEWQADSLAASLLMPLKPFKTTAEKILRTGYIIDDYSKGYYEQLTEIADVFNVSKKAAEIRLRQLGYMKTLSIMCD